MLHKTTEAIILKGDRIEKGKIVDVDAATVAQFGGALVPADSDSAPAAPKEPQVVEKTVEELSFEELKTKAKELGLSTKGSKADLIERIKLQK